MTPVIFREPKDGSPIEAFFPTLPANPGNVVCYAHLGQHCEAALGYYQSRTRPARIGECSALIRELQGIGYADLKVYSRLPKGWRALAWSER